MVSRRCISIFVLTLSVLIGLGTTTSFSQVARFDSYQIQGVPENANIRMDPFYSDLAFFQSVGIRYIRSSGAGMDYLYNGNRSGGGVSVLGGQNGGYGEIKKDGVDFPLISQLTARNYLLISKYMALDISFAITYRAYPMGSQDNAFDVEIIDPGFYARMGSFTFGATKEGWLGTYGGPNASGYSGSQGGGFSANISADFELTPFVRGRVYDRPSYRSDYVDQHGYSDPLSGRRYPVFQNILGLDLDWQMAEDKTFGYSASRIDTIPQNNFYDISRSVIYHQMLEYRQQVNPLTAAGVRANYYWRDYLRNRGSQFQQDYVAFMTSDVTENSSIDVSLGYSLLQLNSAGLYETNGASDTVMGGVGLQTRLSDTLSHGISFNRSQRAGFMAGAELVDRIRYQIKWVDPESWSIGYNSDYESVTPKLVAARSYTDWRNQISASRPLTHDLVLTLASAYSMRMNKQPTAGEIGDGELFLSNNYDTWTTTVGLIQTLTERLKLYYYAEHIARISSNPLLAGTRDTVGMTLGYYYDF